MLVPAVCSLSLVPRPTPGTRQQAGGPVGSHCGPSSLSFVATRSLHPPWNGAMLHCWPLPIDEIAQDGKEIRHRFAPTRLTVLYDAERDTLPRDGARLLHQFG